MKRKDAISPIEFISHHINPLISLDQNDEERNKIISRYTENGKYVVAGSLVYQFNGIDIYTDLNNVIILDSKENQIIIREYSKIFKDMTPVSNIETDTETKRYVLMYAELGVDEVPSRCEFVKGRQSAYENIKLNAPVIDIEKSIVLVNGVDLDKSLSVKEFVEYLKNTNQVEKDGFDIEEYSSEYR